MFRTFLSWLIALAVGFMVLSATPAAAAGTGSVSGTVTASDGAPIAGATVDLRGPASYATQTDAAGAFTVPSIVPGIYSITVSKAGFGTATDSLAVIADQTQHIGVSLNAASFTSLRTIATVNVRGHGQFNVTPASVSVVSAQAFQNQAQPQVIHILNEIPGLQISYPGGSANAALPGAITVPTIRDASSYETASLIDGHPLAISDYGDYVTTFLSSFMFGYVEVIKGPGATAPEVNNAINGTINFHTLDPTLAPTPSYEFAYTSHGGTFENFGISDTILNGRLGFVVDVANLDDPSALNGTQVMIDPGSGSGWSRSTHPYSPNYNFCDNYCTFFGGENNVNNTESGIQTGFSMVGCCYRLSGDFENTSELVKLRYHFSQSTTLTMSYLGGQSFSDQNGNIGNLTLGTFTPGGGYTGSIPAGSPVAVDYLYPGTANREADNEPIFQAEISSALGNDTILARYYHATLYRNAYEGSGQGILDPYNLTVYGTSYTSPATTCPDGGVGVTDCTYNGNAFPVFWQDYFSQTEQNKLNGWSFEYDHPFGAGDDVSFAIDRTDTQALVWEQTATYTSVTLPTGSSSIYTTYQLRGHFLLSPTLEMTVADYLNTYHNTFPQSCPFAFGFQVCAADGSNVTFESATTSHNDPRIAFEFRPSPNVAIRASAGSAIAPPYLGLLSLISPASASFHAGNYATITHNTTNLKAETAFGYDVGADWRIGGGQTIVSGDIYLNNLFNHYFDETIFSGTYCFNPIPCSGGGSASTPVYFATNTNISNFRFEGIELSINRHPRVGFGYTLAAGLQRGYVYNLPAGFYCTQPVASCISNPAKWNQNLNIVAGQNLNGEGVGSVQFYPYYGFNSSISGLNTREPYSQGYGELSYAFAGGAGYASFGETYFGNNNSFNQRAFTVANATLRIPIAKTLSFQVSGNNVFNALSGLIPIYGGGIPIPLANRSVCPNAGIGTGCGSAATVANFYGPATYTFMLTKRLP